MNQILSRYILIDLKQNKMPSNSIEYIRKNYKKYWGTKKNIKKTAKRVTARRRMEKAGKVSKGDGKDVNHKKPLSKGGSNEIGNLEVRSQKANRGKLNPRHKKKK